MNKNITLNNLSSLLAQSTGIDTATAEAFIKNFTDVFASALITDGSLKIKGLGSFDSQVDGKSAKVAFIPERELAETVNAPFKFFEPVVLSDDVTNEELEQFNKLEVEDNEPLFDTDSSEPDDDNINKPSPNRTDYVSDLVAEPITQPVDEPQSESVTESVTEKVTEPVTEPVCEPISESEIITTRVIKESTPSVAHNGPVKNDNRAVSTGSAINVETDDIIDVTDNVRPIVPSEDEEEGENIPDETTENNPKDPRLPFNNYNYYNGEEDEEDFDDESHSKPWFWIAIAFVAGIIMGGVTGFLCHDTITGAGATVVDYTKEHDKDEPADTLATEASIPADTVAAPFVEPEHADTVKAEDTPVAIPAPVKAVETETSQHRVVTDTVTPKNYLTLMAKKHYGRSDYWVYIYLENQDKIPNPNNVLSGTILVIPPRSKYDKSTNESVNLQNAKEIAREIANEQMLKRNR